MADKSRIEWPDATWNPVRGCTKVSPGCAHCYAAGLAPMAMSRGETCDSQVRLRDRKGGDPEEWPANLRVRQWPNVEETIMET